MFAITNEQASFFFSTAEASQNGNAHGSQNGGQSAHQSMVSQPHAVIAMPGAGAPTPMINLNIGMDYWSGATSSTTPAMRGKVPSAPVAGGIVNNSGSRESMQSQLWLQVSIVILFSSHFSHCWLANAVYYYSS